MSTIESAETGSETANQEPQSSAGSIAPIAIRFCGDEMGEDCPPMFAARAMPSCAPVRAQRHAMRHDARDVVPGRCVVSWMWDRGRGPGGVHGSAGGGKGRRSTGKSVAAGGRVESRAVRSGEGQPSETRSSGEKRLRSGTGRRTTSAEAYGGWAVFTGLREPMETLVSECLFRSDHSGYALG